MTLLPPSCQILELQVQVHAIYYAQLQFLRVINSVLPWNPHTHEIQSTFWICNRFTNNLSNTRAGLAGPGAKHGQLPLSNRLPCGGWPGYHRMLRSGSGPCPFYVGNTHSITPTHIHTPPPVCDNKNISTYCQMSLGSKQPPYLELLF